MVATFGSMKADSYLIAENTVLDSNTSDKPRLSIGPAVFEETSGGGISFKISTTDVLESDSTGNLKLSIGPATPATIAGDEISFAASYMEITAEGGAADNLSGIGGGTPGDLLLIRKVADGHNVTVVNSATLICGANRLLTDNRSLLLVCVSADVWSAIG